MERQWKMADTSTITFEMRIKEIIKPSSPTPPHLKRLHLSLFDQLIVDVYVPLVFFYTQNERHIRERSQILKSSLSEVLTEFYPLAGRIKENAWVECNDDGVDYTEGQVIDCSISEILHQPNLKLLGKLLPSDSSFFSGAATNEGPLVGVQVSFFKCGGLAIGIWLSHKVLDGASFAAFIKSWAAICRGDPGHLFSPDFNVASSLFPPLRFPLEVVKLPHQKYKNVIKRTFVFHSSKIAELKAKAASERVPQPSRVEAVTALIWKCAMTASRSNTRSSKPSALYQPVNLRKRIISENSMGNLFGVLVAQIGDGEIQLPVLVDQLRTKLKEATKLFEEKLKGDETSSIIFGFHKEVGELHIKGDDIDVYSFTSWCKFPLYEADFGWGKPCWVSIPPVAVNNCIVLMDTKEGEGIEAWVSLREEDMALFQHDQELLKFASLSFSPLA